MRLQDGANIPVLNDAGETVFVNRRHLEYVESTVYRALMRPSLWRELLPFGNFGIPEWVQSVTYDKIQSQAKWQPVEWAGGSGDIAVASVQVVPGETKGAFWMRSGYKYEDRELLRAQMSGVSLDSERALAVVEKARTELEELAFKGSTTLSDHPLPSATTGIYGIANLAAVTPVTALDASGSTSWTDLISAAITSGTVEDFITCINVILADISEIEISIQTATKQNSVPDTLLMPLSLAGPMKNLLHPHTGKSAYQTVLDALQFIKEFKFWHKLETAGDSNKRRLIAYPKTDERAMRMIILKEPQQMAVIKHDFDTFVPFEMGVMGVDTKLPEAVVYYDMPANA